MPEGPSILILKEAADKFSGKKVISATGNAKIDIPRLDGQKVIEFNTWGKHFLICFKNFTVKIHLLMFGSYTIDIFKETKPRLSLTFDNGSISFYTCSVKIIEGDLDAVYDWHADVLSDAWDPKLAKKKLKEMPDTLVCDALLNQDIFAGVGNIIKNEVLYRIKVQPASTIGALPIRQLNELIKEARNYSFDFLEWKKKYELKKHWKAHNQKMCLRCNLPFVRAIMGKTQRRTFYCPNCQVLYK